MRGCFMLIGLVLLLIGIASLAILIRFAQSSHSD